MLSSDPILILLREGQEVLRVPLDRPLTTLGRAPGCDLRLPDPRLSRLHFELRKRATGLFVTDRSANGTWADGARLERGRPCLLKFGQPLRVPGWELRIERPEPAGEGSTVRRAPGPELVKAPGRSTFGLVGASGRMVALVAQIRRFGRFDVPVLVLGETGTGKELVARAVHEASSRRDRPFVPVNCGAIHGATAHSRLFGHGKGAFTGADTATLGAFREADGGTLFLDELGELPMEQQTALLRVIERKEVVPLGSSKPVAVDFRLVCATHRDLRHSVSRGVFREDLYYRLDVATLSVPPLRDRAEDVPALARHFLRSLHREPFELSDAATAELLAHPWPGNVRELRNCMLRAGLSAEGVVEPDDLGLRKEPEERRPALELVARDGPGPAGPVTWEPGWGGDGDRRRIVLALERSGGNRKEAARQLGLARSTLYARMRKLGLR